MGYTPNAIPNLWNTIVSKYVDYNETSVDQKVHYNGNIYIFNIATKLYSETSIYNINDYCIHEQGYYKCIVDITEGETWTAAHWQSVTEAEWIAATATITKVFDKIKDYNKFIAPEFSSSDTYPNQYQYAVWHNDKLYYNLVKIDTPEEWDDSHWAIYEDEWLYTLLNDYVTYEYLIYPFYSDMAYGPGELVRYNQGLYKAKRNIAAGEWNANDWSSFYLAENQVKVIHGEQMATSLFPKDSSGGRYRGRPEGSLLYDDANGSIARLIKDAFQHSKGCTYAVGDLVHDYTNNCYWKCTTAITTPHDFDSSEWTKCTTNGDLGSNVSKICDEIEKRPISRSFTYSFQNESAAPIPVGTLVTYNSKMYMCKTSIEAAVASKTYAVGEICYDGYNHVYRICYKSGTPATGSFDPIDKSDYGIIINKYFQEIIYDDEIKKQITALANALHLICTVTYNETTKQFEYSYA